MGTPRWRFAEASARTQKLSLWEALEHELARAESAGAGAQGSRRLSTLSCRNSIADRERLSLGEFFKSILDRTGYLEVLRQENQPESQDRIENLQELVNAAAEAEERGIAWRNFWITRRWSPTLMIMTSGRASP